MPRPIAFLLHGYLGAGKTTLARRLEREREAIRFSHDEWVSELHGSDPPEHLFADRAARVSAVMERVWARCLALGCDVVLDFGFWSRAERDRVRALVAREGGQPVLHRLSCPDDIAWRRIEKRNACPDGSLYIAPSTFAALKSRFEPLQSDELFVDEGGTMG